MVPPPATAATPAEKPVRWESYGAAAAAGFAALMPPSRAATLVAAASLAIPAAAFALDDGANWAALADFSNLPALIDDATAQVEALGPMGYLYFYLLYTLIDVVPIAPASPLTVSAGVLFGLGPGLAVVLLAASTAAGIAFILGRTFLREPIRKIAENNKQFQAIDKAVGKEGFKIVLLLRLSPLLPFALSNYFYGLTAIDFVPYFFATMLGFFPGTLAYVYTGTVGDALLSNGPDGGIGVPWYVYVGGFASLVLLLRTVSDVAKQALEEAELEAEQ